MTKVITDIDVHRNCLKSYFLNVAPGTDVNQLTELTEQFTLERFPKNKLIYTAGGISDTVYFICKGLIRLYYMKDEREITNLFVKENNIVVGAYSIITGEKNYSNYEAFEDTYVLKLKYSILESSYTKYHSLEHLGRILVQTYYCNFMKKTIDVLFLSAEERYQLFLKENSDLLNRVSLRYIASYLGISQETLSRLRAKHQKFF